MTVYRNHYDTVILGAGLGALVAGTILARAGHKVILLEEKPYPGGISALSSREGFPFTLSPVLLLGLEKDGYCDQLFSELGLSLAMQKRPGGLLKRLTPFLQVVTERYRMDLQGNRREQLAEYKREWGDVSTAFQRFYQELDELDRVVYPYLYKKILPGPPMPFREKLISFRQGLQRQRMLRTYSRLNSQDYLLRLHLPLDFLNVIEWLNLLWTGKTLQKASALEILLRQSLLSREVVRPVGGLVRFCELLAKICLEYRGEIRYKQGIARMERESRKGWMITLPSGETIHARQLIIHYPWDLLYPKTYKVLTLFFTVDAQVVPPPMSEHLLLYRPEQHASGLERPMWVVLSLPEEERTYIEKKRLLMVLTFIPQSTLPDERELRQLLHGVIKNLHWLMPFSEGKIQYYGSDLQERQQQLNRLEKVIPLLKRLKPVRYPYMEYAYQPFDQSFWVLPDYSNRAAMMTMEVRSAEEVAKHLSKHR